MIVKLLTEQRLEFLSLKGGCRGSPESTLVKLSNCWQSYATAHLLIFPECSILEHPCHGFIVDPPLNPIPGDVVTYGCLEGFEVDGASTRTCLEDYTWEGISPCCVKKSQRMYLLLLLLFVLPLLQVSFRAKGGGNRLGIVHASVLSLVFPSSAITK